MTVLASLGLAARDSNPDLSDFARTLDEVGDLGLGHVEIPAYAYDLAVGGRPIATRLAELETACRGRPHGFTVHGPLTTNFMAPQEGRLALALDVTRTFIEISARIGAPHLVVHAGMLLAGEVPSLEDAYARQRDWLTRAGDIAVAHSVTLCIENLFAFPPFALTPSPARLAREIATIGHPAVKATFDFSHAWIHAGQAGFDFIAEARALAPHAVHLHLHDSFGRDDLPWSYAGAEAVAYGAGDLHLPLGWGSLPLDDIARTCRFPSGLIAIHELNRRFWRDRGAALAASRDFLQRLRAGEV